MSNRAPRRHHTVPRLYLRPFAVGDQVLMRRRGSTADEARNIATVAFTRDFYGFTVDGVRATTVETWLDRNIEGPAAPALRRILDGQWPPSDEDRTAIASFAAFQLLRTPLVRAFMHQIDRSVAPLLWSAEVLTQTLKQVELTDDEKLQVVAKARTRTPAELTEPADTKTMLRTMIREADQNVPRLAGRGWSLLRSDGPVLVTSDNPVAKFFPTRPPAGFTGLAPDDAELHLPLSPDTLLVFERDGAAAQPGPAGLSEEMTAVANRGQALGADQAVFRRADTPWPAGLVLGPHPPRLPEPTITTRASPGGTPTFPARFAPVNNPVVAELLDELGGEDVVD